MTMTRGRPQKGRKGACMKCMYLIMTTTTDTNTGNKTREYSAPMYATAQDAHKAARADGLKDYRVWADTATLDGMDAMARQMVRTACKFLIEKTSADNVNALNLLYRVRAATWAQDFNHDHDAQDDYQAALCFMWDGIIQQKPIFDQAAMALSAVYHVIRGDKAYFAGQGRERLLHLDEMTDADVAYWGAILDDIADDIEREEEAQKPRTDAPRLMDCVNERLTENQRAIMLLLSEGMTQANIARVLDRSPKTISAHVKLARATLAAYMLEKGMHLPDGVTLDDVETLIAHERNGGNAEKRRTAEGIERVKATQAERARRYRERKKAAQMNK